ncbi:MAG: hypothetical protein CMD66_09570 [Gammaproteobacteria bacterium]|nr:hypothetical protein [Gammaproteobacteria bacterium]
MWKVSVAILLGLLVLSFNYVWVNRHQFIPQGGGVVIINKWTGRTCVFGATADVTSYWYSHAKCEIDQIHTEQKDEAQGEYTSFTKTTMSVRLP